MLVDFSFILLIHKLLGIAFIIFIFLNISPSILFIAYEITDGFYVYLSFYFPMLLKFLIKAVQKEREEKLARKLRDFLHHYVRGDKEGFVNQAESEAERLSHTGQLLANSLCD